MHESWSVRGTTVSLDHPLVMGIVNVTPDSFSDGGEFSAAGDAIAHAARLVDDGADILDVGGESTRPQGAQSVSVDEELRRVIPVIRALAAAHPGMLLSVDTVKSPVARAALLAGAHIVNDVSAMRLDPNMADTCAELGAGAVLMHSRGTVEDMGSFTHATYAHDVVDDVVKELAAQAGFAQAAGVAPSHIVIDPGIGFSKRSHHSLRVLGCLDRICALGFPVMVGVSRKRFIGEITGVDAARDRVIGSIAAAAAAFERGARIFRVHDVKETRQALDVAAAIRTAALT